MILEKAGGKYTAARIPGMVLTERGSILAYYEGRKGSHRDWADIDIPIIRSTDGCESFSLVKLIEGGSDTLNNPVMIVDGDLIHFLYCKNYSELYYMYSDDDGESFCEPRRVEEAFSDFCHPFTVLAVGPGHGISYRGRLIVPIWFANNPEDPHAHRPSFVATIYSEDRGKTWHIGELLGGDLINPSECALAALESGVLISMRCENPERCRAVATSPDGISGWSVPRFATELPDPVCEGSMTTYGGAVFHINCDSKEERRMLTVKASRDLFSTSQGYLVDEIGGYSDIAIDGENVFVIYERGKVMEGNGDLCFQKFKRSNFDE